MLVGKLLAMGALIVLLFFGIDYLSKSVVMGPATVVDGDSLRIGESELSLAGIRAMRADQSCKFAGKQWPCGLQAAAALKAAIGTRSVTCRPTGEEADGVREARCYVGTDEDLGRRMVAEGWALAVPQPMMNYAADEDAARKRLAGVWSSFFDDPKHVRAPAGETP